jgi:hypothetical protein
MFLIFPSWIAPYLTHLGNTANKYRLGCGHMQTNGSVPRYYGTETQSSLKSVLRIRIRRIRRFLGLLDPLVRGMDSDPDPSIIKQKQQENLVSYCLWLLFDFLSLKMDENAPSKSNKQKKFFFKLVFSWCLRRQ